MSPSTTHTASRWPDRLKGALPLIVASAAFWALAATLLFFLVPGLETYPRLLVIAECVGLTMVACVLALLRTRRFDRFKPTLRWLLIGFVAIRTGYFVGHQFAFLVLGEPMPAMTVHFTISTPRFFMSFICSLSPVNAFSLVSIAPLLIRSSTVANAVDNAAASLRIRTRCVDRSAVCEAV